MEALRQRPLAPHPVPRSRPRAPLGGLGAIVSLTATIALSGCASSPKPTSSAPRAPAAAAVRVLNNTSSAVRVEAGRNELGEVRSGGEELFRGLAPGTIDLRGISLDGELVFRRDLLTLEPGETFTWVLREGGFEPAATQRTRRDATVIVENGTPWRVEVLLDGTVLGSVDSGAQERFTGIATGSHRLQARTQETEFPEEFPVLEPGESFTWRLRAPEEPVITGSGGIIPKPGTGRLRVENPHDESVTVLVNGTPLGRVEAGATRIFDELTAARVLLAAETTDGRTRYRGPSGRIEPGRVLTWRIGTGETTSGEVADVPAPRREIEVRPADELPEADETVEVRPEDEPGGPGRPPAEPAGPFEDAPAPADQGPGPDPGLEPGAFPGQGDRAFVVENQTSQDLEILLDGRSVGAVGAGMTQRFTELPGPRFTPSARTASGRKTFSHPEVDLSSRQSFTWMILP
jgi:hypothetical protein